MRTKELNKNVYLITSELNQEEFLKVVEGMETANETAIPTLDYTIIEWVNIGFGYKWYGTGRAEPRSELITLDKLKELVGWEGKTMKDLNRDFVYDLRGITQEQAKELYQWLLDNEPSWHNLGYEQFLENYYIYFNKYRWTFNNDAPHPSKTLTKISDMFCEEFKLPEIWCIKQNLSKEVCDWFNDNGWDGCAHTKGRFDYLVYGDEDSSFSYEPVGLELTLEQFNKYVLLQNNNKMKTVTREQLSEIYPLVCQGWQGRINDLMATNQFGNEFEVSEDLIKKAYQEANEGQKLWLNKYLPLPSVDYSKLKAGSVVKLKYTGKHCDGKNNVDFNKPFKVVYANTPHFIGSNCEVDSSGVMKYYYTFIQDGKFILYGSDESQDVDYITEVISY